MSMAASRARPDALAGLGADGHDGREVEERSRAQDAVRVLVEGVGVLLDQVPLVDDHDEADALLDHVAGHVRVLRGQPVDGVDDQDGHVRAADGTQRANRREALRRRTAGDLAAAAHAGRIDQPHRDAVPVERGVDGVARGARDVADDGALLAQQRVEQRALADVGTAHDGDAGDRSPGLEQRVGVGRWAHLGVVSGRAAHARRGILLVVLQADRLEAFGLEGSQLLCFLLAPLALDLGLGLRRQRPHQGVEQVAGAPAVLRADGVGLLPAEAVELGGLQLAPLVVGLVDGHQHRRPATSAAPLPPPRRRASRRPRRRPRRR